MTRGNSKGEVTVTLSCSEDTTTITLMVTGSGRQALIDLAEKANAVGGEYAPKVTIEHNGEIMVQPEDAGPVDTVAYSEERGLKRKPLGREAFIITNV